MQNRIFAAYEACEEYAFWGNSAGGERLAAAVRDLMISWQRARQGKRRRILDCTWA